MDKEEQDRTLAAWVTEKVNSWKDHRTQNYDQYWDAYERLWRAKWASEDRTRQSERSKIITPALQQAVEAAVAEIEETVFGASEPFDVQFSDEVEPQAAYLTKRNLTRDLKKSGMRKAVSESLLNSAVFGTGVTELVVSQETYKVPSTQVVNGVEYNGTADKERICIKWRSVHPRNFVIDPNSTTIKDAMGVAIVEFVSKHIITKAQEAGEYKDDVEVGVFHADSDLEKDKIIDNYQEDRVKLTRYFGLVPSSMLTLQEGEEVVEVFEDDAEVGEKEDDEDDLVEAVVVIANDSIVLKVEENMYMMKDRPVVAFPWDHVPGRFWGRGICEKGFHAQRALDAEVRSRLDHLALVTVPMLAADATKLPRGMKFDITPGKHLLFNGPPAEAMQQFKFGELDPNHWQNFSNLREMIFEATGTNEAGGRLPDGAKTGAVSMLISGMIKRQKRTLFNFYDEYLMPGIEKTAWRYMQYDPDNYPAQDYQFVPASLMGITAREYETAQLTQILQTLLPESPAHATIVQGIVQNTSLHNREQILASLQPQEPSPEEQQMQEQMRQLALRKELAQIVEIESRAGLNMARTEYEKIYKPQIEMVNAMAEARPDEQGERGFERMIKVAELAIKEKDIDSNERITQMQTAAKLASAKRKQPRS